MRAVVDLAEREAVSIERAKRRSLRMKRCSPPSRMRASRVADEDDVAPRQDVRLITVKEAAYLSGKSEKRMYALATEKDLGAVKDCGGSVLVDRAQSRSSDQSETIKNVGEKVENRLLSGVQAMIINMEAKRAMFGRKVDPIAKIEAELEAIERRRLALRAELDEANKRLATHRRSVEPCSWMATATARTGVGRNAIPSGAVSVRSHVPLIGDGDELSAFEIARTIVAEGMFKRCPEAFQIVDHWPGDDRSIGLPVLARRPDGTVTASILKQMKFSLASGAADDLLVQPLRRAAAAIRAGALAPELPAPPAPSPMSRHRSATSRPACCAGSGTSTTVASSRSGRMDTRCARARRCPRPRAGRGMRPCLRGGA